MASRHAEPDFWNQRYAQGKTPWDLEHATSSLKEFLSRTPPGRVLVPGCGTGCEVRAFLDADWQVMAIDFSQSAVEKAKSHLGADGRCVIFGDFFSHPFPLHFFDFIYERTFLCALPKDLWPQYAQRMAALLKPEGRLVGLFLYGHESEPPPQPLTEEEAESLFAQNFKLVHSHSVLDSPEIFSGMERWQEWMCILQHVGNGRDSS